MTRVIWLLELIGLVKGIGITQDVRLKMEMKPTWRIGDTDKRSIRITRRVRAALGVAASTRKASATNTIMAGGGRGASGIIFLRVVRGIVMAKQEMYSTSRF